MKKVVWVIIASLVAACVYICVGGVSGVLNEYDNYLFRKKLQKVVNSGAKELKFKDLTNFEWDKVCIDLPYNGDTYQVDWNVKEWSIRFKKNEAVESIKYISIDRSLLDLRPPVIQSDPYYCYDKNTTLNIEDHKLIIVEKEHG